MDLGNDHYECPGACVDSLAHADSRDDSHCGPEADGRLADRDRLIREDHLDILDSLSALDLGRNCGVNAHHSTVVGVADEVGHPKE